MTDDLQRFIDGFEDEAALRRAIEALLTKMPECTGVRATHGPQELGKDIIFYSKGPMGEVLLNVCVIKNEKITGSAESGAGARTVFHQLEQSFDTPVLDEQGQPRKAARAYVITPHECSVQAMESIKGRIEVRSGQVAFICGNDLLTKFKQYWPDFLLANIEYLGAHVKSLRDKLQDDHSVSRLLIKEGFAGPQVRSLGALYVQPRLACILRAHQFKLNFPDPKNFERPMHEREVFRIANVLRDLIAVISSLATQGDGAEMLAQDISVFTESLREAWTSGFNVHRNKGDIESYQTNRERTQAIELADASEIRDDFSKLLNRADPYIKRLRAHIANSNAIAEHSNILDRSQPIVTRGKPFVLKSNPIAILEADSIRDFYIVSDISKRLPFSIVQEQAIKKVEFDDRLLTQTSVPLLVSGPAGYGKTSFCKWNALRDLEALESKSSNVLPVYIQLHRLRDVGFVSFQDAFLPSDELLTIWREINEPQGKSRWKLRLYLDGLDEVPTIGRQTEIANLAAKAASSKGTQVVMTARDHVTGPWLSWMRRLELQAFNQEEVKRLVTGWLDNDSSWIQTFEEKLGQTPSLGALMKVPLLGTLILAVYKHGHEGLPESRPRLYEMFVRLLAGGWDAAKNINRGSKFASQTKVAVLSHLAGMLHVEKKRDCSVADVKTALTDRVAGLNFRANEVISELIADGLLVPTGSILAFPHLSFQEFLAAKDLVQLLPGRANQRLDAFLKGDDWWREVLTFYVGFSDKPGEMEDWICSGAARCLPHVPDDIVRTRAIELCNVVATNFSNFQFKRETRSLLNWSLESAFQVAKAKNPQRSKPSR